MIQLFNGLATRATTIPDSPWMTHPLIAKHNLLAGQHEIRAWEYTTALLALDYYIQDVSFDPGDPDQPIDLSQSVAQLADIGGAGSNFWKALTDYTTLPITRIDPNHDWTDNNAALYFRETLSEFRQHSPAQTFHAVFAISVIEHVPEAHLLEFLTDLGALVRPGGLLVLTTDVGDHPDDTFHFHWMRERIYTPAHLLTLHALFAEHGFRTLGDVPPDYRWDGPTVYDYTMGSVVLVKEPC